LSYQTVIFFFISFLPSNIEWYLYHIRVDLIAIKGWWWSTLCDLKELSWDFATVTGRL